MNATRPTVMVVAALALLVASTAAPAAAAVADGDDAAVAAATENAGPPTDLPGPVPGFIEEIRGAIQEFVSGLTPGEPAADRPAVAERR